MKPKARPKGKTNPVRKAPGLAAAKTLRSILESAAVRQKAHDAGQDLQKRLRDHNAAIQQRMETHRVRDMGRGDTQTTARVARAMVDPARAPARAPAPATAPAPAPRAPPRRGGFDSGTRPRSRTPRRIIRRPRTPPGPIPRARIYGPEPAGYTPAAARFPTGTRSRGPQRYDIGDPAPRGVSRYRAFFEPP
jgi:hypothetical protein